MILELKVNNLAGGSFNANTFKNKILNKNKIYKISVSSSCFQCNKLSRSNHQKHRERI